MNQTELIDPLSPPNPSSNAIAIVGMSGRYPGGADSPELLWEILKAGVDAVGEAQGDRWDLSWHHPDPHRQSRVYTKAGGYLTQIDGFDAEFFGLSAREARQVDPQQRLLLELAWEALEDASMAPRSLAGSDTGVFVGISSNDYSALTGQGAPDAYSNTGSAFSIAANRISYIYDLHGPSVAVDTACSSSIVCIHQACSSILAGECSMALAGGVSILSHIRPWLGFARASMLSPTGRCKSFDASGDGYVRSEGGGLVLLKSLEAAERDGDRILGVILASGVNSDGRTMGLSMPNEDAQEKLLRKVYTACGVPPEDVVYVEAHGTGTAVGDPIECASIGRVLGTPRTDGSRLMIGSVKSNIGHLEAASGIAGLTKVLLAMKHRQVPGNLHFETPNPKIDFEEWKLDVVVENTPLPATKKPAVIGINSFGFGGTNAHLALQEYRPALKIADNSSPASEWQDILLLSGHTEAGLQAVARLYADYLRQAPVENWGDICAAAATCRTPLRYRLAVSGATPTEAADRLEQFLEGQKPTRLACGNVTADTVPIAFVYSGNGPQWWGMGRELMASSPEFRQEVEAVDAIFAPMAGWSLLEEMQRPESESRIALTEYAQPLLFALQLGLTAVLKAAQIHPSAVLGHSVGEAAAAYACGALTREQATRVIYHRSMAQSKTAGMGGMAAFGISGEEAREAIAEIPGWLELAASNGPNAVTVAGDPEALEIMREKITEAGKFARVLPLNYAFHTRAMDGIQEELVAALEGLAPHDSDIPFISTVDTGELAGSALGAEYWWRNVREPVQFHEAIDGLLQERGFAVFLEIGPHPVLRDYIQQSARARDLQITALQTLRRPGSKGPEPEFDNLWTAICACYASGAGHPEALFTRPRVTIPDLPLYPWQREKHWRGGVALPETFYPSERDHPLLGYRVPGGDGLWEVTLNTSILTYLPDHVVQGAVVFPAAAYIEQALTAARLMLDSPMLDLENFEILRPLVIPDNDEPVVQFTVDSKDGTFEIRSRNGKHDSEWTTHAKGRLSRGDGALLGTAFDIKSLVAALPCRVDAAEHYADTDRRGLSYGPAFQGVRCLHLSAPDADKREAFAEIILPPVITSDISAYLSHPALLDSCLQALVGLIGQNERPTVSAIPVHVERIRSYQPLPSRLFCHVEMQRESARSAVADFRLMDSEGNLVLLLLGARCQKVDFLQGASSPMISEWWRPDPRRSLLGTSSALLSPAAVAEAIAPEVEKIVQEFDRSEYYRDILPRFDRLATAYAAKALAELWTADNEFDLPRLARRGKVQRDQEQLLTRLVEITVERGLLTNAARGWAWDRSQTPESPETLWRELFYDYPRYQTELLLISRAGDRLLDTLRGEAAPLLSSEGDNTGGAIEPLTDTAPYQAPYNRIVRAALRKLTSSWPIGRPLRILEIGGGSGGLTAALLPALPPDRTDYLFTDKAEAAIGRAEQRFRAHRFVRFAQLDLQNDLLAQGLPAGYFDIVIAGNALHGATNLHTALSQLRSLMAPGGQLLAIEASDHSLTDMVFGQDPAWWDSQDTSVRSGSRLLSGDAWKTVFDDAGFEETVIIGDEVQSQQSVILTQVPGANLSAELPILGLPKRNWLLLTSVDEAKSSFVRTLTETLIDQGQEVRQQSVTGEESSADYLLEIGSEWPIDSIVHLAGISSTSLKDQSLLSQQNLRCLSTLKIVQSLEAAELEHAPQLTLVTLGALATANGDGPLDPGQAPLWGLGRVIANENPALHCRLVDLHADLGIAQTAALLGAELLQSDDETEVQLTGGQRYVNRARFTTLSEESRLAVPSEHQSPFILDYSAQGGLDSLYLRAVKRRQPGTGEVEIQVHAAGLNFRDVLWAMGMLPEEAVEHGFSGPTIGMECSGEIVSVGEGVTALKPGDRVIAFASSCFASHVTTSAGSVALIPEGIGYDEAATIPTAFLTAYYALEHLARLAPGERVLIHGAAGGVGLAAIQIAKLKGAVVFGTAGSVGKRRALSMLGVDHVLNSRSLEFADEVMRLTDGVGVDVVLNSLAGEAITKSLQVLRPFGRFLEIGKRDLYANSRIGLRPFRNNLSYFGIDADTLLIERPDLARTNFQAVVDLFASGALRPLPFQSIPISRASEAFRAMQQSKHIGKLVVNMLDDLPGTLPIVQSNAPVRADATYLVTGGLGGFGLSTAQWLVAEGARSLALLSRRGAVTEEALAGIAEMERAGATVRPFAVDIADFESLNTVLTTIRSEMPPLRGVIHSAAVIEDALILNLTGEVLDRVLAPKAVGAWNLHQATLEDSLEMFVLYSSSSAVVGNPGQGAYVAANMYLESLAQYRRERGLPGLAIGWGAIKDAGFLTRHANVAEMLKSRSGLDATPVHEALPELGRLSAVGATRACVARFNLQRLGQVMAGARVPRFLPIIPQGMASSEQSEESFADVLKAAPESDRREMALTRVREHAGRVLGGGANQVDVERPLAEMGLDSLMAVELAAAIERDLGQPISVMQMLSAGNISAIADLVLKVVGASEESAE